MPWDDVLKIVGAALFSVVSAGAIVVGMASWLGKVWAERILRNARTTKETCCSPESTGFIY